MTSNASKMTDAEALLRVTTFFSEIGLPWRWKPGARGFAQGVEISQGVLNIDRVALASVALHEAGHVCILPEEVRPHADGNLHQAIEMMFEAVADLDADSPAMRAALQSGDPEATAWAWAAGVHLDLPPDLIIRDEEFEGEGRFIRMQLDAKAWPGINGLVHAGWCAPRAGVLADHMGLPAYPKLARWLQDDFGLVPHVEHFRPGLEFAAEHPVG